MIVKVMRVSSSWRFARFFFLIIVFLLACSVFITRAQKKDKIFSYCYTPMQFGAIGDGIADDTDALRDALFSSSKDGVILFFPPGKVFNVTGPLNFYKGSFRSYTLNMIGSIPLMKSSYKPEVYGGICLQRGVNMFESATFDGSIERMCITGHKSRDISINVFKDCVCSGLVINGCNFANIGAMFHDTALNKVCRICSNMFMTVFFFSRNEYSAAGLTDTTISDNYINGGVELNDNACFQWSYYNGVSITNNFIDHYRTIYEPRSNKRQPFVGPLSYCNQYQVFRYFYMPGDNIGPVTFSSSFDSFNWTDPNASEELRNFAAVKYLGKDGRYYDYPPFVACCKATWVIEINSAKIERNMGPLVFVFSSLTEYENNRFMVSFVGAEKVKRGQILYREGDSKPFYNNGGYCHNSLVISGIVEELDELPQFSIGWSSTVNGRTVIVGGKMYKAKNFYTGNGWSSRWVELSTEYIEYEKR